MSSERIDIDKRRAALKEIDDAKFGWRHILACLVAGTGFFMDAYDLFAINFASLMIGYVYYAPTYTTPTSTDTALKISATAGTLFGQLLFGYLADRLGRKKMYGVELIIIIIATFGTALAGNGAGISLIGTIVFWRVIMGIGIGGDYPLSAIITSEFATKKKRGAMMGAVFAMQGFGILFAGIVALIVLAAFKSGILGDVTNIDYCWRMVLGLGALPGAAALYFRLTIPETPRYTMDVERNYNKANADISNYLQQTNTGEVEGHGSQVELPKATWSDFFSYFGQWKNGKVLIGTAVSWFCLDVAFYGMGLNNGAILTAIGYASIKGNTEGETAYGSLLHAAVGNIIITLLGTVPGYWFTVAFVDKWGRKPIQIMGFSILTVVFIIMGAAYPELTAPNVPRGWFIFLFTLAQFFQNFGPNATTFIVPGEVFPTRYRSTGHGISAASGKLGAIIAQIGFAQIKNVYGPTYLKPLLLIFAIFMFLGLLASFLIPETKGLSLEELANEEDHFVEERRERIKAEA